MVDTQALYDRVAEAILDVITSMLENSGIVKPTKANLGGLTEDGTYAVQHPTRPALVYLHNESAETLDAALNVNAPLIPECPVLLYTLKRARWVTFDPELIEEFMANSAYSNLVPPHTHNDPYGGLWDNVNTKRLLNGTVSLPGGLYVRLHTKTYWNDGATEIVVYQQQNDPSHADYKYDLSSHVPGAGLRRLAFVGVSRSTGSPTHVLGPTQPLFSAPGPGDASGVDLSGIEVWKAINLKYGATQITFEDVLDWAPITSGHPASSPSHTHDAADITTGLLLLERGGNNADLSGTGPGVLRQAALGADVTILKDNLTAIVPPDVTDDDTNDYEAGSLWIDTVGGHIYMCIDPATGAAVWSQLDGGGGASALDDLSDVIITAPAVNDAVVFDGSDWVNTPLGSAAFSDDGDFADAVHTHDASFITYVPGDTSDWTGGSDPGEVDDALNQLASRTTDIEGAPVWTSTASAVFSAENNVGALADGLLKHASGVPAQAIPHTDYLPPYGAGVIKALSSDKVAAGSDRHLIIAAETGTTDNLIEITGLNVGDRVLVRADSGDTITVKHNDAGATDKLRLLKGADQVINSIKALEFIKTEAGVVQETYHTHNFLDLESPLTGPGVMRQASLGAPILPQKMNWTATTPPTVNDDGTQDYSVGSKWFDTLGYNEYTCYDTTTGAAVWVAQTPVGSYADIAAPDIPAGWLLCNGQAVSRTTYAALFAKLVQVIGTFTAATDDTITLTGHGLVAGEQVYVTNSGGALPTGLTANTLYYVIAPIAANTFKLSATRGGGAVDITAVGSGTHTLRRCAYGLGDGSTTFNLPDLRGYVIAGQDNLGGASANMVTDPSADYIGGTMGEESHTLTTAELASHSHDIDLRKSASAFGTQNRAAAPSSAAGTETTFGSATQGSGSAHNNMQPTRFASKIIKT